MAMAPRSKRSGCKAVVRGALSILLLSALFTFFASLIAPAIAPELRELREVLARSPRELREVLARIPGFHEIKLRVGRIELPKLPAEEKIEVAVEAARAAEVSLVEAVAEVHEAEKAADVAEADALVEAAQATADCEKAEAAMAKDAVTWEEGEKLGLTKKEFDALDSNGDGKINKAEVKALCVVEAARAIEDDLKLKHKAATQKVQSAMSNVSERKKHLMREQRLLLQKLEAEEEQLQHLKSQVDRDLSSRLPKMQALRERMVRELQSTAQDVQKKKEAAQRASEVVKEAEAKMIEMENKKLELEQQALEEVKKHHSKHDSKLDGVLEFFDRKQD